MEFPDLGSHCSFNDCHQLDFLPIECLYCKMMFCKLHSVAEKHSCNSYVKNEIENIETHSALAESYKCSFNSCKRSELVPVLCNDCDKQFCVGHRLPPDHNCHMLEIKQIDTRTPKEKVENIIGRKLDNPKKNSKKLSSKTSATNAKVQQMKLKMKAKGNENIPSDEKIYFNIFMESDNVQMFFSSQYSIGKIIDEIAKELGLKNENHLMTTDKKIKLFNSQDVQLPTDSILKDLLQSEERVLVNYDTIYVKKC